MLSRHLVTGLACALVASSVTAAIFAAPREPKLLADYPPRLHLTELPETASLPRHLNALAAPEKRAPAGAPGVCDYPGPYIPCWCGGGIHRGMVFSTCNSAEEYLNDVQEFGPPRLRVPLPRPATEYTLDGEIETE